MWSSLAPVTHGSQYPPPLKLPYPLDQGPLLPHVVYILLERWRENLFTGKNTQTLKKETCEGQAYKHIKRKFIGILSTKALRSALSRESCSRVSTFVLFQLTERRVDVTLYKGFHHTPRNTEIFSGFLIGDDNVV